MEYILHFLVQYRNKVRPKHMNAKLGESITFRCESDDNITWYYDGQHSLPLNAEIRHGGTAIYLKKITKLNTGCYGCYGTGESPLPYYRGTTTTDDETWPLELIDDPFCHSNEAYLKIKLPKKLKQRKIEDNYFDRESDVAIDGNLEKKYNDNEIRRNSNEAKAHLIKNLEALRGIALYDIISRSNYIRK